MENYMVELLAVELPRLEVGEVGKELVVVNSVCMSLEHIKLIHETLYKNIESLKEINETFTKCVDRIQFLLTTEESINIFHPKEPNFRYLKMGSSSPITDKEFSEAFHYILFQNVKVNEPKEQAFTLHKWQKCLARLLPNIDLTSYCNKVANAPSTTLSKENPLSELFWQIHKAPTSFLIDSNKVGEVKVTAYFLSKYFDDIRNKNLLKEFNELLNYYKKAVEEFLEKKERLEQSLRMTINSLSNKIASIESRMNSNESNVYQCLLARGILDSYTCWYEIVKVTPSTSKGFFRRSATTIIREEDIKFSINLEELKKSPTKKKREPQRTPKKIEEYDINLNNSFLEDYSKYTEVRDCIESGKDKSNICQVYYEYFKRVRDYINIECKETIQLSEKNKEEIFDYIYDYAMLKIYGRVFPSIPSISDKEVMNHISSIKANSPEDLHIKPDNRHEELWDLSIKS